MVNWETIGLGFGVAGLGLVWQLGVASMGSVVSDVRCTEDHGTAIS